MRPRGNSLAILLVFSAAGHAGADPVWVTWPDNGHEYAVIPAPAGISWTDANAAAQALAGELASINSAAENDFIFTLIDHAQYWKPHTSFTGVEFNIGPWIGGHQPEAAPEPDGDWVWTTSEGFNFKAWYPGEPNEGPVPGQTTENRVCFWVRGSLADRGSQWNDFHDGGCWDGDCVIAYVVERGCVTSSITGPTSQSLCPGSTATFTVTPNSPGSFSYQWQKGGQPLADGAHITGSSEPTLTITNVTTADAGSYACLVTDPCGPALSPAADLLIISVTIEGPAAQAICAGGVASFTVVPAGLGPFIFAWQKDGQPLSDNAHVSGSATDTLTISDIGVEDVNSYACLVTNICGSVLSAAAGLTIVPNITVDGPIPQTVCAGGIASFSVAPSGSGPFSFAWQKNGQPLADDAHVSGSATDTLTISGSTMDDVASYECLVANACGSVLSAAAELLIIPAVNIEGPSSQSACQGGNASFSVTVTPVGSGPHTYAWQKGGQPVTDDAHIAGSSEPTLAITGATIADVDSYACLITGPCGSTLSSAADLMVFPVGSGDGDMSETVNGLDIPGFAAAATGSPSVTPAYCVYDMNADGVVNADDLPAFLAMLMAE